MKLIVAALVASAAAAMAGSSLSLRMTADGLNVIVVVDVTASAHRCPAGIPGLVSSTLAGRSVNDRSQTFIPPAISEFLLNGPLPDDRVRVGALARRLYLSESHSGGAAELKADWRNLFRLPPVDWLGPSPIWDVLGDLIEMLAGEPGPRAIILISDGQATGNRRSPKDVASLAREFAVRISVVGEESIMSTRPVQTMEQAIGKNPTANLKMVAEHSGGRFYFDKANVTPLASCYSLDPGKFLPQAFADLRTQSK
jgi:hypothetical protein